MTTKFMTTTFNWRKSIAIVTTLLFQSLFATSAFAQTGPIFTYHGRLVDSVTNTVVTGTVNFLIQLQSTNSCLMYEEVQSKTLSQGVFALNINSGVGTTTYGQTQSGYSFQSIMSNTNTLNFNYGTYSAAAVVPAHPMPPAAPCTFTPSPARTDARKLIVYFFNPSDPSMVSWEPLPVQTIGYVPMAVEALNVGGFTSASLLRFVDGAGNPFATTPLSNTNYTELMALLTGTSNLYLGKLDPAVGFTGNLSGDVTGLQAATVVSKLRGTPVSATAPVAGQYLIYNGTSWTATNGSGGTVTNVSSPDAYITVTNPTTTPSIKVNVGTVINTVAAGNDPRIINSIKIGDSAAGGDLAGTYPSPTVAGVGGKTAAQVGTSVADTLAATNLNTASSIVKRDASGNIAVSTASATNFSGRNYLFYDNTNTNAVTIRAPNVLAGNLNLTLPANNGTSGYVLITDGAGNMSWANPATGNVTSVTALAPVVSSGGQTPQISMAAATDVVSGYLSATDHNTFNNLRQSTSLPTGQAWIGNAGGLAAPKFLNISDIKSATVGNPGWFAAGNCPSGQMLTYTAITDNITCQTYTITGAQVAAAIGTVNTGQFLIGNAGTVSVATMSGDTAVNATGVVTVQPNAITTAKINNLAITDAKINDVDWTKISNHPTTIVGYGITDAVLTNAGGITDMQAGTLTARPSAAANPLRYYISTDTNETYFSLAGAWVKIGSANGLGGTVTSVNTGVGLSGGPFTTSGTISLANTLVTPGVYGSATAVPTFNVDAQGRLISAGSSPYADATGAAKGIVKVGSNITLAAGTISVTNADVVSALGYTPSNAALPVNQIFVGSAGGVATSVGMTGDASIISSGLFTLANTTVAPGLGYTKVDVDSKGRVTNAGALTVGDVTTALTFTPVNRAGDTMAGSLNMGGFNITNSGNIIMAANKSFGLSQLTAAQETALVLTPADKGRAWYNTTTNKMMYWDGAAPQVLANAGGSVSLVTATAPIISTGGTTPNISMPAATTAVNGYLTSVDFTTFNNKQVAGSYITALTGDVVAAGPGSAAAVIANNAITTAKIATGAITDAKINDVAFSKITAKPTTLGGYGITDAISSTLTAGNIYVGNATNVATSTALSGDIASVSATGVVALSSTVTAGTVGSANAVPTITYDAKGRITSTSSNAYQDATGATKGIVQAGANLNVAAGVISVATANTTTTGVITFSDWNIFNNKQNALGFTPVNKAGDIMLGSLDMGTFNITNSGNILMAPNKSFGLSQLTAIQEITLVTSLAATDEGRAWYNSTTNKMMYWDGAAPQVLASAAGSVSSVTATAPIISSGGTTPNISMPAATTAVNGYLTSIDFTTFNNKQAAGSYITALTGDVVAAGPGSAASTIQANAITTSKINNLAITDAKINDVAFSKLTAKPTTLGGYGITDAISSTLTAGNIYVGNATNVATSTALSGDIASVSATGVVALSSTVTAGTVGSATAVPTITYDAKGRITSTSSNAYQDATGVTKGIVQAGANINVAAGVISMNTANSTTTGVITFGDWNIFNNKLTSSLASGTVFVGNSGGVATSTTLSGDILSVSNTGIVALKNTGTAGTFGSASAIPAVTTDAQGRVTGITTSAYQDGTAAAKGVLQVGTNLQVAAGTISLQNASSTLTGALTSADWVTFNAKQNALGFTPVNKAGDIMLGSLDMGGFNITNSGNILMAANKSFGLSQLTTAQQITLTGTLVFGDKGRTWYNTTNDKMMYWDGTTAQVLSSASGSVSTVTATAPIISSGGITPNISMPAATITVDGYLSATDFTTFNNKQTAGSYITALTGDVVAAGPGSAASTIQANAITTSKINNLAITDAKINDVAFSKITAKPTTLGGYGITDAISSTLTAGNIYVGNATNVATSTALSGDIASVSATGVVALSSTVTAGTIGSASAVPSITYDAKGRITSTTSNAYQDATGVSKGIVQAGANINVAAGVISVNTANSTTTGVITSGDWNIFNNKLTSSLAAGTVFVGNAGGVATSTTLSGDILSVSNTGIVALKNTGTAGTFGSASAIPSVTTDAQGRVTGITTSAYQDGTAAAKGVLQVGTNLQVAAGTISLQNASSTLTGALTSADWVTFNNKQNALVYTPVNKAGDIMLGSLDMGGFNITNSGNILMAANKSFGLSQLTTAQQITLTGTLVFGDKGRTWYNTTNDKMMYWDGAAPQVLANTAGSVSNVTATAPVVSSGGTTPNISMPAATTAVNGYLSSTDFTTFNNKQTAGSYITALTGDVVAAGPGSAASTIQANAITTSKINNLAVTDAKINDVAFSKITAKPTTLGGYGITDAISSTLTAGNIYVGNATNVATSTALSGDIASVSSTGSVTLSSVVVAGTIGSASAVPSITYDAKGRITSTTSNAYQDATGATKGIVQAGANINVAAGVISVPTANTTTTGVITFGDWNIFNNKQAGSAELTGLAGLSTTGFVKRTGAGAYTTTATVNAATEVTGTLPVANGGTGAATLSAGSLVVGNGTGAVTALAGGTTGNVIYATSATTIGSATPDTAGLVDKSSAQTITGAKTFNANVNLSTNARELQFAGSTANYVGFKGPSTAVTTSFAWELPGADGTAGQVLKTNGLGVLSWVSAATGSVTNVTGTAPISVATGTSTPVISMTQASTTVNGYLTSTDFTTFNNKLGTASTFSGDVSGTSSTTSVDKIKGTTLTIAALTTGNLLKYNGTAWINSMLALSDIPNMDAAHMPAFTGDVTSTAGTTATTIANNAVTTAKINNLAVTDAKINDVAFSKITGTPTTVAGYGITDAVKNVGVGAGNIVTTMQSGNTIGRPAFGTDGRIYIDTQAGITYRDSGTAWINVGSASGSGGTVTSVTGTAPINVATGTTTPVISLNNTTVGIGTYGSATAVPSFTVDAQGRLTSASSSAYADATGTTKGIVQVGSNLQVAGGVISLQNATSTLTGALTSVDWNIFNNKQAGSAELTGLAGLSTTGFVKRTGAGAYSTTATVNAATEVTGTLPVANGGTGVATLPTGSLVIGAGTGAVTALAGGVTGNVIYATSATTIGSATPDTAGLVDKSSAQTITGAKTFNANVNLSTNTNQLQFPGTTANYVGFKGPSSAVTTSFAWELPGADGTTGQVLKTNGAGVLSWVSAATGSVTNVTGTAPISVATGTSTPVISMTQASTTVNGYLTSTDFVTFNNKLGTASTFAGDVSGTSSTTSVDKIKGTTLTIAALTTGNLLKYNGTAWINSMLALSDIPNMDAAHMPAFTGDVTSTAGTTATTIANNAVTTTKINNLAVTDAKIFDVAWTKVTGTPTTVAGYGITDAVKNVGVGAGNIVTTFQSGNTVGRPAFGTDGRMYVDTQAGITYRDSGTAWINVGSATGSGGTVTNVTGTAPISVATGTTTPVISLNNTTVGIGTYGSATAVPSFTVDAQGRLTTAGSSAYVDATGTTKGIVQAGTNINVATGVLSVNTANTTTTGVITSVDWNIFNNKQAGSAELTGLAGLASNGFVKRTGAGTYTTAAAIGLATADVTGTLPVANGGTGAATLAAGSLVVGNGTTAVTGLAGGVTGNVIYATSPTAFASGTPDTAGLVDKTSAQTISGAKTFTAATTIYGGNVNLNSNANQLQFAGLTANYVGFKGPSTGVTTSFVWELPAADGTVGQVLKTNGAGVLGWVTNTGGTVTSVTSANTDITIATTTTTPVLTLNSGVLANQILKLNASAQIPAVSGALLTNLDATNITAGILPVARGGTGATTLTSNGVLLGNGTTAVTATAAGAANSVLRVPAGGGAPVFGAIDLTQAAAVTGTLAVANGGTGATTAANNTFFMGPATGGPLAPSFRTIASTDVSAFAYVNNGNSFGAAATIGTNDAFTFGLKSNGQTRLAFDAATAASVLNGSALTTISGSAQVNGQAWSTVQTSTAATPLAWDTNTGNTMRWTPAVNTGLTVNITNIKSGASYMLVVKGSGTDLVNITCNGAIALPALFIPANAARVGGTVNSKTVYTLMSDGENCLITWITGY